jgi:flagellar assembly protein FliH
VAQALPARIDADLRDNPYAKGDRADPRLVDPTLVHAFDELAAEVREKAQQEGFAAGFAEGLRRGHEEAQHQLALDRTSDEEQLRERTAELARARDVLLAAAADLEARQTTALADVEALVLRTAYELAETIVGRELELATDPWRDAVMRAMALVPADSSVVLRLHPADAASIESAAEWALGRDMHVVPDPILDRGDCVADAGPMRVDARVSAALARVREVLAP